MNKYVFSVVLVLFACSMAQARPSLLPEDYCYKLSQVEVAEGLKKLPNQQLCIRKVQILHALGGRSSGAQAKGMALKPANPSSKYLIKLKDVGAKCIAGEYSAIKTEKSGSQIFSVEHQETEGCASSVLAGKDLQRVELSTNEDDQEIVKIKVKGVRALYKFEVLEKALETDGDFLIDVDEDLDSSTEDPYSEDEYTDTDDRISEEAMCDESQQTLYNCSIHTDKKNGDANLTKKIKVVRVCYREYRNGDQYFINIKSSDNNLNGSFLAERANFAAGANRYSSELADGTEFGIAVATGMAQSKSFGRNATLQVFGKAEEVATAHLICR